MLATRLTQVCGKFVSVWTRLRVEVVYVSHMLHSISRKLSVRLDRGLRVVMTSCDGLQPTVLAVAPNLLAMDPSFASNLDHVRRPRTSLAVALGPDTVSVRSLRLPAAPVSCLPLMFEVCLKQSVKISKKNTLKNQ